MGDKFILLYNRNVFHILEIEPSEDKKAIKKTYAKLVKRYHPEEYPEKWKEIHDAYEAALKMAESTYMSIKPEYLLREKNKWLNWRIEYEQENKNNASYDETTDEILKEVENAVEYSRNSQTVC